MHAPLRHSRRTVLALACFSAMSGRAQAAGDAIDAPNVVPISARLVTSGQPTAAALARLSTQGFGAVIYLAPLTVSDAVPGEAEIVRQQGLDFIHIPIPFGKPTDEDFEAFADALKRLGDRKVLVHCQVSMRASTLTFLYRVIVGHEKPEAAFESVAQVWSPAGPWKQLLLSQLRKSGSAFEPY